MGIKEKHRAEKNGNLELTSDYGSYIFWYPMGFRSEDSNENKAIESLIAKRKIGILQGERLVQIKEDGDNLSFTFMNLPEEAKNKLILKFNINTNSLIPKTSSNSQFFQAPKVDAVDKYQLLPVL